MKLAILLTAALGATLLVTPASARWEQSGQVHFGRKISHASTIGPRKPALMLRFVAKDSDIFCRQVRARFGGGREVTLFSGALMQNAVTRIDLPRRHGLIERLDFRCRSNDAKHATIHIWADIVPRRPR